MKLKLTQKQETFCLKYFEIGNATEAALLAGYSPKTARIIASINLTKINITNRIQELRTMAEGKSVAGVLERKQILTEILRGKVTDFVGKGNRIEVGEGSLNTSAIQELNTSEVQIGRGDNALLVEITKLRLHNPIQAADLLNKMDKLYGEGATVLVDNSNNRSINIGEGALDAKGQLITELTRFAARIAENRSD